MKKLNINNISELHKTFYNARRLRSRPFGESVNRKNVNCSIIWIVCECRNSYPAGRRDSDVWLRDNTSLVLKHQRLHFHRFLLACHDFILQPKSNDALVYTNNNPHTNAIAAIRIWPWHSRLQKRHKRDEAGRIKFFPNAYTRHIRVLRYF